MDLLKNLQVHHWPYLLCIWSTITLTITYTVSVSKGHVYKYFTYYISDTGTLPPESCIFSQMVDIDSIILAIIFYFRYRQLDLDITEGNIDLDRKWNTWTGWMAPFICLGFNMVGNFQVISVLSMHALGAVVLFGVGITYCIIQTKISFATRRDASGASWKYNVSKTILVIRVLFSIAFIPLFLGIFIFGSLSLLEFTGDSILYWTEKDGGHTYRLVSVFCEWALLVLLTVFPATFIEEFKVLKFEGIKVSMSRSSNDVKSKIH